MGFRQIISMLGVSCALIVSAYTYELSSERTLTRSARKFSENQVDLHAPEVSDDQIEQALASLLSAEREKVSAAHHEAAELHKQILAAERASIRRIVDIAFAPLRT